MELTGGLNLFDKNLMKIIWHGFNFYSILGILVKIYPRGQIKDPSASYRE